MRKYFLTVFIKLNVCGWNEKWSIKIQRRRMCVNHLLHLLNFLSWYCAWFQLVKWYFRMFFFVWPSSCAVFYCLSWICSDPGILKIFSWEAISDLCAELLNTCFISSSYCSIFFLWISQLYSIPSPEISQWYLGEWMHSAQRNHRFNFKRDYYSKKSEHLVSNCDRLVFEMIFIMPSNFPFYVKYSAQNLSRSSILHSHVIFSMPSGLPNHDFETLFLYWLVKWYVIFHLPNQLDLFSQNNLALKYCLMPI